MEDHDRLSYGWCPDLPDTRDFVHDTFCHDVSNQSQIDLRDEGLEFSCNAFRSDTSCATAVLSALDWCNRKWGGSPLTASASFVHRLTIRVWGGGGIHGVSLRSTLKTLKRFGSPPEHLWPSSPEWLNKEPRAPELFAFANQYRDLSYYRLDAWMLDRAARVGAIRNCLARGNPCVLGFATPLTVQPGQARTIPLDMGRGGTKGGTACVVIGYDDLRVVRPHVRCPLVSATSQHSGAFLIKTCWGNLWGDHGYGWLPFAFIESRFACDAWLVTHRDWD